jgi:hypothetical protein
VSEFDIATFVELADGETVAPELPPAKIARQGLISEVGETVTGDSERQFLRQSERS